MVRPSVYLMQAYGPMHRRKKGRCCSVASSNDQASGVQLSQAQIVPSARQFSTQPFPAHRSKLVAFCLALASCACLAQTATTLSQVKKIYVEPLGAEKLGTEFRDHMIARLRKDATIEIVGSSEQADAVLSGTGRIWITGYVSENPRSPATNRHPVYEGYLAAELIGQNHEPLWSYLVTPSRFAWRGIIDDLTGNLASRLLDARREKNESGPKPAAAVGLRSTIHGAGATFPFPMYQKWFESFQERNPDAHVSYDAIGSEKGFSLLADGKLDFAATEIPLTDEHMEQLGAHFKHLPSVLGGVVPIYHLQGTVRTLKLTPELLADIYLGKIKRWNDPKIRAVNHGISLPAHEITVVHRSDGSGTTFVWSDFLAKTSPEWKTRMGANSELAWPVGIGVERNDGVAAKVKEAPDSIGYVEMVYALQHGLNYAAVRNASGQFVHADLASVRAAAASAEKSTTLDFRVSITNAPGAEAYPIASFTWMLLPENIEDSSKKAELIELLRWILTSGQKECSELGYAPLPREVADRELQSLEAWK
jgi:phosphate transport system substrate-binding protein